MDRPQLTIMANKFQSVFDASRLDARGNALEFCQRQRLRLMLDSGVLDTLYRT